MTFADALKALPGDVRNRVCFRIWMAVEDMEAITLAVDRILTMSEKQKFQIMETILAEPPEPMSNLTKEQIENGPNTLKAKWLDPECWDGCQSLVLKNELDRVKRQAEARREALETLKMAADEDRRDGEDMSARWVWRIAHAALQPDTGSDLLTHEQVKPLVDCIEVLGSQNHNLECPLCSVCVAVDKALAHAKTLGL